jgi:hypothetical protein
VNGYHKTRTYFVVLNTDGAARFAIDFIPVHQIRTTPNPVVAYQLKQEQQNDT